MGAGDLVKTGDNYVYTVGHQSSPSDLDVTAFDTADGVRTVVFVPSTAVTLIKSIKTGGPSYLTLLGLP
jgi:hypothetical protein